MNVLVWHVHGSYTTSLVQGEHTYVIPVVDGRGPDGRGRADTWQWPDRAVERRPEQLPDTAIDVVVAQRPRDLELLRGWTGLVPGRDVPVVYLEHNTPGGDVPFTVHPMRGRTDLILVHVTAFNAVFWDTGRTPVQVVEHGVPEPGLVWTPDVDRAAVVVNDPVRRGRAVGTDLLPSVAGHTGVDVFGMGVSQLAALPGLAEVETFEDVTQQRLHQLMSRRRVYLHLNRWTSLGFSLIEALALGMPVAALATTAVADAVPPEAGCVTTDPERLASSVVELMHDDERAAEAGRQARATYEQRFTLGRFLDDWDAVFKEACA